MNLDKVYLMDELLVSIDAGKHGVGVAAWNLDPTRKVIKRGYLVKAAYVPFPEDHLRWGAMKLREWLSECGCLALPGLKRWRLLVEQMKIYSPEHSRADPADLIEVSHVVGACCSMFDRYEKVEPFDWKGNKPKDVTLNIIQRDLELDELARMEYPRAKMTLGHNVNDAVFLGWQAMKTLKLRKGKGQRWAP